MDKVVGLALALAAGTAFMTTWLEVCRRLGPRSVSARLMAIIMFSLPLTCMGVAYIVWQYAVLIGYPNDWSLVFGCVAMIGGTGGANTIALHRATPEEREMLDRSNY
jgi:hypothetical protein